MDESRKQFEYEAGQALCLPTSIIELARKGDGYDHAFDSMNIMQPLNGWWHWWKKSRAVIEIEPLSHFQAVNAIPRSQTSLTDAVKIGYLMCAEVAGIKVKE